MKLQELRDLLPDVEIEDDEYCIGYWMRWAGQERPHGKERREGWDDAVVDIDAEREQGSAFVGAASWLPREE